MCLNFDYKWAGRCFYWTNPRFRRKKRKDKKKVIGIYLFFVYFSQIFSYLSQILDIGLELDQDYTKQPLSIVYLYSIILLSRY